RFCIDINHNTGKFTSKSIKPNKLKDKKKKYKIVQLFHPKLIKATIDWYEAFLSSHHPGCETKYAKDDAFFYINIVNEDSLFRSYFESFGRLSKDNRKMLETQYKRYRGNKNVTLCEHRDFNVNDDNCTETINFLKKREADYYKSITNTIKKTGYSGLITTTNSWYGVFNRDVNNTLGDAMNTHIYFSPVKTKTLLGKRFRVINNKSFVSDLLHLDGWDETQLFRIPATHITGTPMIISEWNHSLWSDYLYEGAIILLGLSLQYDVSVMTVHTIFDRFMGSDSNIAKTPYTVFGNPVLYAMLPSLSKAFIDYKPAKMFVNNRYMLQGTSDIKDSVMQGAKPLNKKQQSKFYEKNNQQAGLIFKNTMQNREQTNVLSWHNESGKSVRLMSEKFVAIAGKENAAVNVTSWLKMSNNEPGAVLFLSMDDRKLEESSKILITTVSGFRQGESLRKVRLGSNEYYILMDAGSGPQRMSHNKVKLVVQNHEYSKSVIRPVYQNKNVISGSIEANDSEYIVGNKDTPWYILERQ
ncbi:MAG: hypothetical protein ABW092_13185, partial [Candidatus Thiodiazotropha sp.]